MLLGILQVLHSACAGKQPWMNKMGTRFKVLLSILKFSILIFMHKRSMCVFLSSSLYFCLFDSVSSRIHLLAYYFILLHANNTTTEVGRAEFEQTWHPAPLFCCITRRNSRRAMLTKQKTHSDEHTCTSNQASYCVSDVLVEGATAVNGDGRQLQCRVSDDTPWIRHFVHS